MGANPRPFAWQAGSGSGLTQTKGVSRLSESCHCARLTLVGFAIFAVGSVEFGQLSWPFCQTGDAG